MPLGGVVYHCDRRCSLARSLGSIPTGCALNFSGVCGVSSTRKGALKNGLNMRKNKQKKSSIENKGRGNKIVVD